MTIYRATVLDTPVDERAVWERPDVLRVESDAAIVVRDGRVAERGPWTDIRARRPREDVVDLREGVLLPGFVDAHAHAAQVHVLGRPGMPLPQWLEECALPEEERHVDVRAAHAAAHDAVATMLAAGTTTALVFGSHLAAATEAFLDAAVAGGLRVTAGPTLADRGVPPTLRVTPAQALAEGRDLLGRRHGRDGVRYAVVPRFAPACTDDMLAVCAELQGLAPGVWTTTHVNEAPDEIAQVRELFPGDPHYVGVYDRHGLVHERSVFAHSVHPGRAELDVLAARGARVAHCPTSNVRLGSGLFPLRRHLDAGVRAALGSDIGAGAGLGLLAEAREAAAVQQLSSDDGVTLTPARLLWLATRAGALALGEEEVGDLSVGRSFDAVWVRPAEGSLLARLLAHADDATDALGRVVTLAGAADIAGVWTRGARVVPTCAEPPGR
ncbi:guanine deaminase [Mobilicoccus pelagius]|uniref:Guanine deaminase n=1 Tax=Mobilicoccus pelagius NBRC 104925 TaxID=1089455 RepID=H5UW71_9MICO|nr:guanine deaminase [Mobilicoccus pelagius]GAB49979.1 guanine deaminase [Mobilicoccus pelagius NBRC 104925]